MTQSVKHYKPKSEVDAILYDESEGNVEQIMNWVTSQADCRVEYVPERELNGVPISPHFEIEPLDNIHEPVFLYPDSYLTRERGSTGAYEAEDADYFEAHFSEVRG